jgi:hypothetical protein
MNQSIKPTDVELQVIDIVVSRFIAERKPTPRRQLLLKLEDPDLLDVMINRFLLRDVNHQAVLPGLLAFYFQRDENHTHLFHDSLGTVLHALRALYLDSEEENKQLTPIQIETKARELGKHVTPNTIWLGLYLAQNYFNIFNSSAGSVELGQLSWVTVGEGILRYKKIDTAWETRIAQEMERVKERDALVPATHFQLPDYDTYPAGKKHKGLSIFISHSSKDAAIALSLIELLKAALELTDEQIRCTSVDGFRLPSGANVDDVLKSEVHEAQAFIGLITPKSVASAYVLFELGARWGARRHMIPVLAGVGPEALQGPLKGINSISANSVAQLHQLLSDLADALDIELQRAASYTRYAEKLIAELQRTYKISAAPPISQPPASENLEQEGGERRLRALTRNDVIMASKTLNWKKQLPKWTVEIEGTSFPVRPLAFKAAGLFPNDSATTHQAVAVLKRLGFQVFYENKPDGAKGSI